MAMSLNLQEAVTGEYPYYALDGTKLVLSRGSLQLPDHCAVEFDGEKLKFNWQGGDEQG